MENENRDDEIEKIIERKVQERLDQKIEEKLDKKLKQKQENPEKDNQKLSRREFLKKTGIGAAGLAAMGLLPASAFEVKTAKPFDVYTTDTSGGTLGKGLSVDTNQNVAIPSGNLDMNNNNIERIASAVTDDLEAINSLTDPSGTKHTSGLVGSVNGNEPDTSGDISISTGSGGVIPSSNTVATYDDLPLEPMSNAQIYYVTEPEDIVGSTQLDPVTWTSLLDNTNVEIGTPNGVISAFKFEDASDTSTFIDEKGVQNLTVNGPTYDSSTVKCGTYSASYSGGTAEAGAETIDPVARGESNGFAFGCYVYGEGRDIGGYNITREADSHAYIHETSGGDPRFYISDGTNSYSPYAGNNPIGGGWNSFWARVDTDGTISIVLNHSQVTSIGTDLELSNMGEMEYQLNASNFNIDNFTFINFHPTITEIQDIETRLC